MDRSNRVAYDRTVALTTSRFRGIVSYDGTDYVGWQTQPSGKGVQDVIEQRLSNLLGGRVYVAGSGRTDRGVHARAQVFHFELPTEGMDIRAPHLKAALAESDEAFAAALDRLLAGPASGLPNDVQVMSVDLAPAGFHSRDSCLGKRYVYTVHEGAGSPFVCRYRWVLGAGKRLDVAAMQAAAEVLRGTHDFSTFGVRMPSDPRDPNKVMRRLEVRRLHVDDPVRARIGASADADVDGQVESVVTIVAECDRYLFNMMRMISGTLVQVGLGRLGADEIGTLLAAKGRTASSMVFKAPPQGLCMDQCFMVDDGPHPPWVHTPFEAEPSASSASATASDAASLAQTTTVNSSSSTEEVSACEVVDAQ